MRQVEAFLKYNFMQLRHFFRVTFFSLIVSSCDRSSVETAPEPLKEEVRQASILKYAKRFSISTNEVFTRVDLYGDRYSNAITSSFLIYSGTAHPETWPHITQIKAPCEKVAALSSIYATMLCELGAGESLVAIDNIDYVNNAFIIKKHSEGKLKELMKAPQIDLEQAVVLHPDIIFTFGMGEGEKDKDKKLEQTGIPVAISIDHLEESPLARAEWIKFFAVFVNKEKEADSIFNVVEKNYYALKEIAAKTKERPTVFNEIKYSDSWYMPGGKSFVAQLLHDAAANYLWKEDTHPGSLPLSFEQVFAKAQDADFWINLSTLKTKKELLGFESRYAEFKAYKNGSLYNNTKVINSKGYSNYWETGMIYPDRILSDLIQIFHPEVRSQINKDFHYYEQIR